MLYIKDAALYTPYNSIKDSCILIEDGKIRKLAPSSEKIKLPTSTQIIDAKNRIVCPGFIDVHVQGAGGYDFLDGTKEALSGISSTLAKFGTTSYLATTVFKNGENANIKTITNYKLPITDYRKGAQLLGIHLEGPFVNIKKRGMIRPNGISECLPGYFDKIIGSTNGRLKMMTIAPELSGAIEIIKKLRMKNIIASFGHSDADYEEAREGVNAGITHATHVFNAMRSMHHRDPGGLTAVLMDDRVSVQLIADGVHVHPAVIRLLVRLKGIKNIVLITDSMSSQGLPDGRYIYDGWEYESRDGACRYKDGTLIGTALTLNKMIKSMVKSSGVSLLEALQMATINPARILGVDDKKGVIEEGKDADLVIMDRDLNILMTLVGGEIVYKR